MKKWLSDANNLDLVRHVDVNELKEVSVLAEIRLIKQHLVLLQPELNKNYLNIASDTYPYSSSGSTREDLVKQLVTNELPTILIRLSHDRRLP